MPYKFNEVMQTSSTAGVLDSVHNIKTKNINYAIQQVFMYALVNLRRQKNLHWWEDLVGSAEYKSFVVHRKSTISQFPHSKLTSDLM